MTKSPGCSGNSVVWFGWCLGKIESQNLSLGAAFFNDG